jgi:hypothetical protein
MLSFLTMTLLTLTIMHLEKDPQWMSRAYAKHSVLFYLMSLFITTWSIQRSKTPFQNVRKSLIIHGYVITTKKFLSFVSQNL